MSCHPASVGFAKVLYRGCIPGRALVCRDAALAISLWPFGLHCNEPLGSILWATQGILEEGAKTTRKRMMALLLSGSSCWR
jgi:hypothetical protein